MRIAGVVSLCKFPMFEQTVQQLKDICDGVFIRFDCRNGDPSILQAARDMLGDKLIKTIICDGWPHPMWREECLRMMDEYRPDVVLCPDEDEMFDKDFTEELKAFWHSDKLGMMFNYHPLMTHDNRIVNNNVPYPPTPHMKAFKWREGLSYFPYHGDAVVAQYCNKATHWMAKSRIKHYSCWTKAMEASKHWKSNTPNFKGVKAVTLVGFGPSSDQHMQCHGEIWSVNNCYEVLSADAMRRCTRVFEMHKFGIRTGEKWDKIAKFLGHPLENRDLMKASDGRLHIDRLDEMGRQGRRIIMQEPHAGIFNSEPYPIHEVIRTTGLDWFMGTPCYMVALAIAEGYSHISIYGLDHMDWEHTLQRECFVAWMCYAIGRGITIDGALTWLQGIDRRYGYDYGPEFDQWCEERLWRGHPLQIHYKIPSRIVEGQLFKK